MAKASKTTSGGGAAAAAGIQFQVDAACYFATLLLSETMAEPHLALPQDTTLVDLVVESAEPVDDINIRTSNGGVIFVQVKRAPDRSDNDTSPFASAVDQFVRQFLSGVRTPGSSDRPLDPARDRLVLAVSHDTPATITEGLADLLDKLRQVQGFDHLGDLPVPLNQNEEAALRVCRAVVQRSWSRSSTAALAAKEELTLLHAVYVLPLDFRSEGHSYLRAGDLLRTQILSDPLRSGDAWRALLEVCRSFGPRRTGGDAAYFRQELTARGIPLKSAPSFAKDIVTLKEYTAARLKYLSRLSRLELGGVRIKLDRPVVTALQQFASDGSCAVIGAPGAGKSGSLHDLAAELATRHDVVLLTADMVKASSPTELATDLRLTPPHTLVDVLANWSGDGLGYLIVDALDAARAGMSLHVLCEVLREVGERATRWRVVASIREYDLRTSPEVQDLFRGQPHSVHFDSRFPQVRHVSVQQLSVDELGQLQVKSPTLADAVNSAPAPLARLLTNPFNLSLLCKLLDQHVAVSELGAVRTQVGLLDLYWLRRVELKDHQASASERRVLLTAAVRLMVDARELHVSRLELEGATPLPKALDAVLSDGILTDVASPAYAGRDTLGFAHNILFDYATHRLWLSGLSDPVIDSLSSSRNHDLLLAIRASIIMAFETLWHSSAQHDRFWNRTFALHTSPGMHFVGKIIAPGVAAQHFVQPSDFAPLLAPLSDPTSPALQILRYTVQAAVTQFDSDPSLFPVLGDDASEWMSLAATLCDTLETTAWTVRGLLLAALRSKKAPSTAEAVHANRAAVALIHFGLSDRRNSGVVRPALEMAVNTMAANITGSTDAIRKVLTPEAIALGGHEWLHPVAERLDLIARFDSELALEVVDAAFGATGSRDDAVLMGGRLLPLTMNKHDLLGMARHEFDARFASIMKENPGLAARMLILVVKREVESEHPEVTKAKSTFRFSFKGGTAHFKPDASHIWATGEHNRHDDWFKVLEAFKRGLVELAESGRQSDVETVLLVLRDQNVFALIWSAVLDAAAHSPDSLAGSVAELLACPAILGEVDTRKAAGDLIARGFKHLTPEQRTAVETAILNLPVETKPDMKDYAIHRRNRILGCVPRELLASPQLREIRDALEAAGGPPPNTPDFLISTSWGGADTHWWLREQGVETGKAVNADLLRVSELLKKVGGSNSSQAPTASIAASYLPLLHDAVAAIDKGRADGADEPLIQHVDDELIDACERLASAKGLKRAEPVAVFIRSKLREGSTSLRPEYDPDGDAQWDKGPAGWSSPSPRVDAAAGLMKLAASSDLVDPDILRDIDRLSRDPVPAVRYQVLSRAGSLYHTAPPLMWSCIERTCLEEPRAGVVDHFCFNVILRLPTQDYQRLEPLVRRLFRRSRRLPAFDDPRRACANFYMLADLWHDDPRARRYVRVIARSPTAFPDESNRLIDLCRQLFTYEDEKAPKTSTEVRNWAVTFLTTVVTSLRDEAAALRATYSAKSFDEWPEKARDRLRLLYQLAHNVATEVHIGLGAAGLDPTEGAPARTPTPSLEYRQAMLRDCRPLFDILCDTAFVEAAYDVLQTLEHFIDADPLSVVLWVASIVRKAEADGIQYESMAADLVVRIVERYLSEYAPLFRINPDARTSLLDVLGVFVGAGWPGATKLTDRLGEVFR